MGEMLAVADKAKPGEHWEKKRSPDVTLTPILADLCLCKRDSAEAQTLAALVKAKETRARVAAAAGMGSGKRTTQRGVPPVRGGGLLQNKSRTSVA